MHRCNPAPVPGKGKCAARKPYTFRGREKVTEVDAQIDSQEPIVPQIAAMVDRVGLTPQEWQTLPIIINPPSLNFSAVVLMAELHGHCGYFPAAVRLRPVPGSVPPRFEVAEIVNLQAVREEARKRR
ncbi:CRISPR-associated protein Csx15 [Desulfothermobacter acidiphilus]|uniref:CRISPR-associated protein Csx15 n=1 Tax=Desulfothermobacter acidiphilus TaxID=1938353 RepID=UPI003F8A7756